MFIKIKENEMEDYDKAKGIGDLIKFQVNDIMVYYATGAKPKILEKKFRQLARYAMEFKEALGIKEPEKKISRGGH